MAAMVGAGFLPFLAFVIEHRVSKRLRRAWRRAAGGPGDAVAWLDGAARLAQSPNVGRCDLLDRRPASPSLDTGPTPWRPERKSRRARGAGPTVDRGLAPTARSTRP